MLKELLNQKGILHILPLLIIIAAVGIISFLLISSTAPSSGLFGILNPKPASHAASSINASLGQPTSLTTTSLDSTIRANWTPSTDTAIAWQVASVWDGTTLIGSKVVSKSQNVADLNGLQSSHTYTVKIQSMDLSGALSIPLSSSAATDLEPPMANVAFFENFNEDPNPITLPTKDQNNTQMLDPNFFDVRTYEPYGDVNDIPQARQVIRNERHYHTLVMGSNGEEGVIIRPRVPFDISGGRSGTFEFETDLAPGQHSHGKWFEIFLVDQNEIPGNHEQLTAGGNPSTLPDHVNNSMEFDIFRSDNDSGGFTTQHQAVITARVGGKLITFPSNAFDLFTQPNVRVPVVVKVSQTAAQMYVNGKLVVDTGNKATLFQTATLPTFTLPFSTGYWEILHTNYRSGLFDYTGVEKPATTTQQLIHWDNIQFDGPIGSFNPVVRTYVQPNCSGLVVIGRGGDNNQLQDCDPFTASSNSPTVTLSMPDDLTKARSARLLFNGGNFGGAVSVTVSINGNPSITIPTNSINGTGNVTIFDLTSFISQLKTGANTFAFKTNVNNIYGLSQLELEVVYNQQRTIGNPPAMPMPMLNATKSDFRFDLLPAGVTSDNANSGPGCPTKTNPTTTPQMYSNTQSVTTNLYNMGGVDPVNYTLKFIGPSSPWISVTTSSGTISGDQAGATLSGSISSAINGGKLEPVTINIDFTKFTPSGDPSLGLPAIIEVDGQGVNMPVYITVLGVKGGAEVPCIIPASEYTPFYMSTYNKCGGNGTIGVPGYEAACLASPAPSITLNPTSTPTATPTITSTPTPSSPTCPKGPLGDIDCDGIIGIFDYNILIGNFRKIGIGVQGDVDGNGKVDIFDYNILVTNFGK